VDRGALRAAQDEACQNRAHRRTLHRWASPCRPDRGRSGASLGQVTRSSRRDPPRRPGRNMAGTSRPSALEGPAKATLRLPSSVNPTRARRHRATWRRPSDPGPNRCGGRRPSLSSDGSPKI
jgi:hypothetical protein